MTSSTRSAPSLSVTRHRYRNGASARPRDHSTHRQVGHEPFRHRRNGAASEHCRRVGIGARAGKRSSTLAAACVAGRRLATSASTCSKPLVKESSRPATTTGRAHESFPGRSDRTSRKMPLKRPLVLVFEVRAIGIAIDFDRQQIVALSEIRRQVETPQACGCPC